MDLPSKEILDAAMGGQERTHAIIRYRATQGDAFARVILGLTKPQKHKEQQRRLHVHVDVALRSYFATAPKATHKRADLDRRLRHLIGQTITLYPSSEWTVPGSALGEGKAYPWNADIRTEVGGLSMELIGADFRVAGGEITYLHWRWEDREPGRMLILGTTWVPREAKIEPDYLATELSSEETYLRSSILGEPRQLSSKKGQP